MQRNSESPRYDSGHSLKQHNIYRTFELVPSASNQSGQSLQWVAHIGDDYQPLSVLQVVCLDPEKSNPNCDGTMCLLRIISMPSPYGSCETGILHWRYCICTVRNCTYKRPLSFQSSISTSCSSPVFEDYAHAILHLTKDTVRFSKSRSDQLQSNNFEERDTEGGNSGDIKRLNKSTEAEEPPIPLMVDDISMFDQFYFDFDDSTEPLPPIDAESSVPSESQEVQTNEETAGNQINRSILDQLTGEVSQLESNQSMSQPRTRATRSAVSSNIQPFPSYCPHATCPRGNGGRGFKRRDNVIVHRRNIHKETIDRLPSGRAARRAR